MEYHDINSLINNKAYSGDKVEIFNDNDEKYIIKTWSDINKGKNAIDKQIRFKNINISGNCVVKSPSVYESEIIEKKFFRAKMSYIEGECGIDIPSKSSRQTILKIREVFGSIIYLNFERAKIKDIPSSKFIEKLLSIKSHSTSPTLSNLVSRLIDKFKKLTTISIPIGDCHGDLTMSNIIFSGSESIYLIDFLPSFIETPLWDIVKLEQDLIMGWSYRYVQSANKITAKIVFDKCIPNQLKLIKSQWEVQTKLLSALNLARIIPYVNDPITNKWLELNLNNELSKL